MVSNDTRDPIASLSVFWLRRLAALYNFSNPLVVGNLPLSCGGAHSRIPGVFAHQRHRVLKFINVFALHSFNVALQVLKNFEKVDGSKVTPAAHFSNDLGLDSLDAVEVRFHT